VVIECAQCPDAPPSSLSLSRAPFPQIGAIEKGAIKGPCVPSIPYSPPQNVREGSGGFRMRL
jgi:hypothetical protein